MKNIILTFSLFLALTSLAKSQDLIVPILDLKIGGLIGGVQNGRFISPQQTVSKITDSTRYMVYDFAGIKTGSRTFNKPAATSDDICPDFFSLEMFDVYPFNLAVGSKAPWKVMPRIPQKINLADAGYKKAVADFLVTKGFAKPIVILTQAFRIDLEGDGQEEVVLTATRVVPIETKKQGATYDEYSIILMRRIVDGKVKTILLDGETYPKNTYDYDGNRFEISSFADLNGDGTMELVVYSAYYEGNAVKVYEMKAGAPTIVKALGADCGV